MGIWFGRWADMLHSGVANQRRRPRHLVKCCAESQCKRLQRLAASCVEGWRRGRDALRGVAPRIDTRGRKVVRLPALRIGAKAAVLDWGRGLGLPLWGVRRAKLGRLIRGHSVLRGFGACCLTGRYRFGECSLKGYRGDDEARSLQLNTRFERDDCQPRSGKREHEEVAHGAYAGKPANRG